MAAFTKTISVGLRLFGGGPSTKWGQAVGAPYTMTWGVSKWGEGAKVVIAAAKLISNQITPDSAISKQAQKLISISVSPASDMLEETLASGVWKYVFVNNTTNGEERDPTMWAQASEPTTTFACQPAGGTVWS